LLFAGETVFALRSSAGNAILGNSLGGLTTFVQDSTAGRARLTNTNGGLTTFAGTSTADQATVVNSDAGGVTFSEISSAGRAAFRNRETEMTTFADSSTAGEATILNEANGSHRGCGNVLDLGPVVARLGAGGGWQRLETSRNVDIGEFFDRPRADYDGWTAQVFGEVAYPVTLGPVAVEPFAGLTYVHLESERFTERGGPAALTGSASDSDLGFSTLGLRGAWQAINDGGSSLTLRGALGWEHAFGDVTPSSRLVFRAGGTPFTVAGASQARHSAPRPVSTSVSGRASRSGWATRGGSRPRPRSTPSSASCSSGSERAANAATRPVEGAVPRVT
jgi:hypothetical protein